MSKKSSTKAEKVELEANEKNNLGLYKHVKDWRNSHPHEEWISPKQFQNLYPQYDKFSTASFRKLFYVIKKKIQNGEYFTFSF